MSSLSPSYTPILQKPECCAVACLQMILYRRGQPIFEQEHLAEFFDIHISKKHSAMFSTPLKTLTRFNKDEGMDTTGSADRVTEFFVSKKIPLRATSIKISAIPDLAQFISHNLEKNNDMWVEYKGHIIHTERGSNKSKYLHDGLVESIDLKKQEVVLLDPYPEHKQRISVPLEKLQESLAKNLGKETGFLIIETL